MAKRAPQIRVVRLDEALPLPSFAHPADAGLDLFARDRVELEPGGGRATVRTGVALELPAGHVGLVCPRSGLAADYGVTVLNSPGVIDEGYRGEIAVVLVNTDPRSPYLVERGDRIAQLLTLQIGEFTIAEVPHVGESDRGDSGFGASGP